MRRLEMTVMGVSVAYRIVGEQGAPVLFLHGWGCSGEHFEPIARALSGERRCVLVDFPAHGKSGRPPEPWGVPEFADMTLALMRALEIAPCDIVAHSFGGRVALYLAANHPEVVKTLALTGCAGVKREQTAEQKKRSEAYRRKKKLAESLARLPLLRGAVEKTLESLRQRYGSADYNALDADMRKTFVKIVSLDLRPLLPRIQAPTLLVWGNDDTETPLELGKIMEKEMPNAGLAVIEGDHFAYLAQWQRFVRILEVFYKEGAS